MGAIRFLLYPFAVFYDMITSFRNYLYDVNFLRSTFFDIPTIVVGNLSVGGTGKSPQIEYLVRLLQKHKTVAVLSRGYKRKSNGFILLDDTHLVSDVGDEPLQFFNKFSSISVAVDANRVHGIQQLKKTINPDIVLLDDAYQHRRLKAGLYILLTRYDDLYSDDFILPVGSLRESKRGAKRAHVIVVTKCPENLSETEQNQIISKLRPLDNQAVFFSKISYTPKTLGFKNIDIDQLSDCHVLLITGIANTSSLIQFLEQKKCTIDHLKFPDHYNFSKNDVKRIKKEFDQIKSNKKLLLTTEKDYTRLSSQITELSFLEITTTLINQQEDFDNMIKSFCEKSKDFK